MRKKVQKALLVLRMKEDKGKKKEING